MFDYYSELQKHLKQLKYVKKFKSEHYKGSYMYDWSRTSELSQWGLPIDSVRIGLWKFQFLDVEKYLYYL